MTEHSSIRIAPDVVLGKGVRIYAFVNLYGCTIGDECKIGTFVEMHKGASVGRRCKISSHTFICEGETIEGGAFDGHRVVFLVDPYLHAAGAAIRASGYWMPKCRPLLWSSSLSAGTSIAQRHSKPRLHPRVLLSLMPVASRGESIRSAGPTSKVSRLSST